MVYHNPDDMAITEPLPRAPGRPRNEVADRKIIEATLRLLSSEGYDRTSIEAVAAEAEVTRATVYRRYPTKADMVKQVMDKYGAPTIVGDQHLYYIYRGNSIVSVGGKFNKPQLALDAIDKPLEPRMALKLNAESGRGRGSCVAVVKRSIAAKEKSLAALLEDAKGANCDGVFSVQFTPATQADRVSIAQFILLDVKRVISAAAIDAEAGAAGNGDAPKGSAPKL